nr:hypothetical protein CFP56_07526 [Quercus suber]
MALSSVKLEGSKGFFSFLTKVIFCGNIDPALLIDASLIYHLQAGLDVLSTSLAVKLYLCTAADCSLLDAGGLTSLEQLRPSASHPPTSDIMSAPLGHDLCEVGGLKPQAPTTDIPSEPTRPKMQPRGEERPSVMELADFVRKIDALAPGSPPRPGAERKGRIRWPASTSPLTASSSPSDRTDSGSPWLTRRHVKHSVSAQSLSTSSGAERTRGQSLHSLSEYHETLANGAVMTSPLAPPPLPAEFAHLAHHVPNPISLVDQAASPSLPPPQLPLRQERSSPSLRAIFGMRPKSPATGNNSKLYDKDDKFLRVQEMVRQESVRDQERAAKKKTKTSQNLTQEPGSPASEEAEREAKIQVGRKLIARTSMLGWVTKKPMTELTDEEVAAVGLAVMEKEPRHDKSSHRLRDVFRFVGVQQAKMEYLKSLKAHKAMCKQANSSDPARAPEAMASTTATGVAFDPAHDIEVTTTIEVNSHRLSTLQWYNSTMAMLEGKSPEDVKAAATRDDPSPHSSDEDQKYSLMFDDPDEPYDLSVLNLPEECSVVIGEAHEEHEKTLSKLTGDYGHDESTAQTHGLGIYTVGDTVDHPRSTDEEESLDNFYDPRLNRGDAESEADARSSVSSYASSDVLPISPLVPAPLKVRSPQGQQYRSVSSPLAGKRSGIPYPTRAGDEGFHPLRDEAFLKRIAEEKQKRMEALAEITHPLLRQHRRSRRVISQTTPLDVFAEPYRSQAQKSTLLGAPNATPGSETSLDTNVTRRVIAPKSAPVSSSSSPVVPQWSPSLPPTPSLSTVPLHHQANANIAASGHTQASLPTTPVKSSDQYLPTSANSPVQATFRAKDHDNDYTPTNRKKQVVGSITDREFWSISEFLGLSDDEDFGDVDGFMNVPVLDQSSPAPRMAGGNIVHQTQLHSPWRGNTRPLSAIQEGEDNDESSRNVSPTPSDCSTIRQEDYTSRTSVSSLLDSSSDVLDDVTASPTRSSVYDTAALGVHGASLCKACHEPALTRCGGCNVLLCTSCSTMCEHTACLNILCGDCGAIGLCDSHIPKSYIN